MTDAINLVNQVIDEENRDKPAATRRQMIAGSTALLGGMGLLGASPAMAQLSGSKYSGPNTPQNILNVAVTAEALATIVNTVGVERVALDGTTRRNVAAAADQEKEHFEFLLAAGAKPAATRIWVPNEVFENATNLLTTLAVGDQIFINAYLLGVTVFARPGNASPRLSRYSAEIMGVEAVHRALALQSLGRLGNDRVYMRFAGREETPNLPTTGTNGFYKITEAVTQLQGAGFGFGAEGSKPGQFYEYDEVSQRTAKLAEVHTRKPV